MLVSSGDPEANRQLAKENDWNCDVLLEQYDESVLDAWYRVFKFG